MPLPIAIGINEPMYAGPICTVMYAYVVGFLMACISSLCSVERRTSSGNTREAVNSNGGLCFSSTPNPGNNLIHKCRYCAPVKKSQCYRNNSNNENTASSRIRLYHHLVALFMNYICRYFSIYKRPVILVQLPAKR